MVPTVEWHKGAVRLLDQSRLPETVAFLDCRDVQAVASAIRELKVRGAPAIGVTAAMGVALGAQAIRATDYDAFVKAPLPDPTELADASDVADTADSGQSLLGYRPDEAQTRWPGRRVDLVDQSGLVARVANNTRRRYCSV
jgi:hypothetical protein